MDGKPSAEFVAAISAAADRFFHLTYDDLPLRTHLREAARAFIEATAPAPQLEQLCHNPTVVSPKEVVTEIIERPTPTEPSNQTSIFDKDKSKQRRVTPSISNAELQKIEARCRLKAEATGWAITRQELIYKGAKFREEIEPKDKELFAKAKLQDCYLWMNRSPIQNVNVGYWHDVTLCFESVADALVLIQLVLADHPRQLESSLDLLAEAQSALRCAIGIVSGLTDTDQSLIYQWLREITSERKILVKRFMRADDSADPATCSDIAARIYALYSSLNEISKRRKQQNERFRKIKYHLKAISSDPTSEHDWRKVISTIEELVNNGLPPSNIEIRELLMPHLEELPEQGEHSAGFSQVLQEIERYLDSIQQEESNNLPEAEVDNSEVQEAKRILKGKTFLFVGGRPSTNAIDALKKSFGLKELIWSETVEHKSLDFYEPYLARPNVGGVFLAIRWSSHSYGNLKQLCKKHGKQFVRLPAGYNPNQVAHHVVQQLGDRQTAAK